MFTGIIQSIGTLSAVEARAGDQRLIIEAREIDAARMALGDSIAVAGVCLTVAERSPNGFAGGRVARDPRAHHDRRSGG